MSIVSTEAHPKQDDEEEYLEEGAEDVRVAAEEEDEGDEGRHSPVENLVNTLREKLGKMEDDE